VRAAAERDVEVVPLSRYNRGRMAREGLQLGFLGRLARNPARSRTRRVGTAAKLTRALQWSVYGCAPCYFLHECVATAKDISRKVDELIGM
jgi:hypothetical protein